MLPIVPPAAAGFLQPATSLWIPLERSIALERNVGRETALIRRQVQSYTLVKETRRISVSTLIVTGSEAGKSGQLGLAGCTCFGSVGGGSTASFGSVGKILAPAA